MNLGPLRALACELVQSAHGVPATVTRPWPDDTPVETTGVWRIASLEEPQPYGMDLQRREPRRIFALPRRTFESVPRGTLIVAPETSDGTAQTWRVDGIERIDPDFLRVIVVPQATL
jgi:hypothetical protein